MQVPIFPAASVAVQATCVSDGTPKESPDVASQTGATLPSRLSVAVGLDHSTVVVVPDVAIFVTSCGQVENVGAVTSVHVSPDRSLVYPEEQVKHLTSASLVFQEQVEHPEMSEQLWQASSEVASPWHCVGSTYSLKAHEVEHATHDESEFVEPSHSSASK